jgi:hypothetical protein
LSILDTVTSLWEQSADRHAAIVAEWMAAPSHTLRMADRPDDLRRAGRPARSDHNVRQN